MRTRFLTLLALVGLLPAALASADDVVLKGGSTLSGIVLDPPADVETAPGANGVEHPPVRLLLSSGDEIRLGGADVARIERDTDAPPTGKYVRYLAPAKGHGGGLEVAIATYVPRAGGPRIDLVGVVHMADAAYYRELQRVLESADVVLYEAVKPKDQSAEEMQTTPEGEEMNPVRGMQTAFARWFGLEFQLDAIEYGRPHFVHADLTAEDFAVATGKTIAPAPPEGERSEPGEPAPTDPLMQNAKMARMMIEKAIESGADPQMWKGFVARMLGTVDAAAMLGVVMPGLSEVLLEKRNAVVIDRIREWSPKTETSIAVFYGAAHMPDIERCLVEDLGYRRAGARWLRAWDVK